MAVRREEFSLRAGCTAFLPHAVLPIFSRDDAEPGGPKFWLERRYWEHEILAKDQLIDFRKQELKRGILQRLVQEYELSDFDFLFPERRHDPLLSTSRGLMLWLGERWIMAIRKGGASTAGTCSEMEALDEQFVRWCYSCVRVHRGSPGHIVQRG